MNKRLAALSAAAGAFIFAGSVLAKPGLQPSITTPESADKTVVITSATKHVNVFENESVLFKVGDKQFALRFDGNNVYYDLATLAPAGLIDHKIKVYVAPNPTDHQQGIP